MTQGKVNKIHTNRQTDRKTDRTTHIQKERQTDIQTDLMTFEIMIVKWPGVFVSLSAVSH